MMRVLINFLKGIVAGIGGIVPGLSGSVLMVLLGVYEPTIHALGTLMTNFKKNIRFLLPLLLGMGCGVLLFSKAVDYLLEFHPFQTRYAFLGLVLGTVPLFYRQIGKHGFPKYCYGVIVGAAALGFLMFGVNRQLFPTVTEPSFLQAGLMGVFVAASSIVPGIDSAVILSTLGFYELYIASLADINLHILLPEVVGVVVGAVVISAGMNFLMKKAYTITFSGLFGFFLSIIPNMLNESCRIQSVADGMLAVMCALLGCLVSYYLGDIRGNNKRIKTLLSRIHKSK